MTGSSEAIRVQRAVAAEAAPEYRVRRVNESDAAALSAIERDAFPTQWPPTRFLREIKRSRTAYLAVVRDFRADDPGRLAASQYGALNCIGRVLHGLKQLAFFDPAARAPRDYIAGFVGIWFIADEAHIVSIGVRSEDKRKGLGELLLLAAFREARRANAKELTLEVRASNEAAKSLYRKYGFREAGLRKRYYIDNGEDAIIMTTPPIANAEYAATLDTLRRSHAARWGHSVQPAG